MASSLAWCPSKASTAADFIASIEKSELEADMEEICGI
jgi:hypothetical protein